MVSKKRSHQNGPNVSSESNSMEPVFITQSAQMEDLYNKVLLIAKSKAPVLITGENGTGKEIISRLIHYHSSRISKPLIAVNCGAIPSDLVESELFGHEVGAFTGAVSRKEGCFEMANGGSLFLDEIGEMPLTTQVKLLRIAESEAFRRIGGRDEINVDVRLISATNKMLIEQVKSGTFREDLYYRLNVIELYVPPLRQRKEDIDTLLDYYLKFYKERYEKRDIEFSDEVREILRKYYWPGNVRELKNLVERAAVLCTSKVIDAGLLPENILANPVGSKNVHYKNGHENGIHIPLGTSIEDAEREIIYKTLDSVNNNKAEAARLLGFTRKTLHNKLEKFG